MRSSPGCASARRCRWVPALDGWLVLRRDVALHVMGDAATFTVDDPRFSTGRVVGPSMLTLDGAEHHRHRAPFARPFRLQRRRERFTELVADEVDRLIDAFEPRGQAELLRDFAGPLAAAVVTHSLGLREADTGAVLGWYDAIVAAVTEVTAGGEVPAAGRAAFADLSAAIEPVLDRGPGSSLLAAAAGARRRPRAARGRLERRGDALRRDRDDRGHDRQRGRASAVQPGPARARRARTRACCPTRSRSRCGSSPPRRWSTGTRRPTSSSAAPRSAHGDLVRVSVAAANRDPTTFPDPDRFDVRARERSPAPRLRARAPRLHRDAPRAPGGAHRGRPAARAPAGAAPRSGAPVGALRPRLPQAARAARPLVHDLRLKSRVHQRNSE